MRRCMQTWLGYLGGAEDHFDQRTGDSCNGTGHVTGTDLWADFGNGSVVGGDNAVGINGTYSGYIYSDRAVAVITEHGLRHDSTNRPMFMYLALHNIHGPDEVTEEFLGLYDGQEIWAARRTVDAMVSAVDSTVANVSLALERAGMAQDTLTVLVSDKSVEPRPPYPLSPIPLPTNSNTSLSPLMRRGPSSKGVTANAVKLSDNLKLTVLNTYTLAWLFIVNFILFRGAHNIHI